MDNFDYIPLSDGSGKRIGEITLDGVDCFWRIRRKQGSGKRIGEITLDAFADAVRLSEIGRASCRERV